MIYSFIGLGTVNTSIYQTTFLVRMYQNLPENVKKTRSCINVRNNDKQSFKWAILSALHPVKKDGQRMSKYKKFEHELNFSGISFPVQPLQIPQFEKQNDISIDVYTLCDDNDDDQKISPLHKAIRRKVKHIDLLLIQTANIFHYVWIKNLSRLLKDFTVLSERFSDDVAKSAQSENRLDIMDKVRGIIYQKAKKQNTEELVETSKRKFDQVQQKKFFSKDISTQTNFETKANEWKTLQRECYQKMEREKSGLKYSTSNEDTEDDLSQGSSKTCCTNPLHKETSSWNEIDYANWDDPNELIDRLRILMAEQTAGNQIHLNEIVKIIEELREAGYIY